MKPAAFAYCAPRTLEEAISLLDEHGYDAKLLAGGQSLVPLMNLRLARPTVLVDINRVGGLAFVESGDEVVRIGAMTRHHTVATSSEIRGASPLLSHAAGHIGYRAIRHRGTLGGSLAHADPASELPCVAVTQSATVRVTGSAGERTIRADELFLAEMTTTLAPDEIVTSVAIPRIRPDEGWGFREFVRKVGDFAVVMAAALLRVAGGRVGAAPPGLGGAGGGAGRRDRGRAARGPPPRLGLGGAEGTPRRVTEAEQALVGSVPGAETIEKAARVAAEAVEPTSDIHGSADYRRRLVHAMTRRALQDALGRLEAGHG